MINVWLSFIWRLVVFLLVNGIAAVALALFIPPLAPLVVAASWAAALWLSYLALSGALKARGIDAS